MGGKISPTIISSVDWVAPGHNMVCMTPGLPQNSEPIFPKKQDYPTSKPIGLPNVQNNRTTPTSKPTRLPNLQTNRTTKCTNQQDFQTSGQPGNQ